MIILIIRWTEYENQPMRFKWTKMGRAWRIFIGNLLIFYAKYLNIWFELKHINCYQSHILNVTRLFMFYVQFKFWQWMLMYIIVWTDQLLNKKSQKLETGTSHLFILSSGFSYKLLFKRNHNDVLYSEWFILENFEVYSWMRYCHVDALSFVDMIWVGWIRIKFNSQNTINSLGFRRIQFWWNYREKKKCFS